MSEEQKNKIGEMLTESHTLIQQAEKVLYELESFIVEATREHTGT